MVGAPLNIRLTLAELAAYLGYLEPRALLAHASLAPLARELDASVAALEHVVGFGGDHGFPLDLDDLVAGASTDDPARGLDATTVYMLAATSGTTGVPKGAVLTNGNALAAIACYAAELPTSERETVLQNIPLFFNPGGPAGLHPALTKGGRTVLYPGFEPATFLDVVPRYRVNHTILVPTMIRMVLDHPAASTADLSTLRGITCGGSPVSKELLLAARPVFGDVFRPTYGMAETYSCGLVLRPENQRPDGDADDIRRLGSAGKPHILVDVEVVADDGKPVPRDGATAGEVLVRGDVVAGGYFRMAEETAESFAGGWMHTGDLATIDGDGFITIVDRKKDIIISGGINVAQPRGRGGAPSAPRRRPGRRHRRAARAVGRGGARRRRRQAGGRPRHRRHPRLLRDPARQLQEAPHDRGAGRAADQRHGQGPQARAEGAHWAEATAPPDPARARRGKPRAGRAGASGWSAGPEEDAVQVPDLLRNPAKRFPDRLAVIEGSRRLTFAEVDRRADQLAAALQARGIEPGDRVALLAMNELEYLEIQVAAQRLGAILVPLNYRLAAPELDFIVRNSGCRLLIHGPGYEVTAKGLGVADNLHLGPTGHGDSYDEALAGHTDPAAFGPLDADTPCTILYTSGTTGRPKGAVLTNLSVYARCAGNALELRVKPGDVFVQTLPMFHIAANLAYSFTYVGATLALVREFSPPTVLEVLRATSATHVLLVPTTINMLNNHPGIDEERFDDLRMVLYGASAIAPDVLRRAIEVFGCGFLQFFGMTETSGCSLLRVHDHDPVGRPDLLASAGTDAISFETRVVDQDDHECPPGVVGEIVTRGPALMVGYGRPRRDR